MIGIRTNKSFHELKEVVIIQAKHHVETGVMEPQALTAIASARGGQSGLSAFQIDDIQLAINTLESEYHELLQEWQQYKFNPPSIVGPSISLAVTIGVLAIELLGLSYCFLAILEPGIFPIATAVSFLYLLSVYIGKIIPESARAGSQRLGLYLFIGLVLGAMRATGGIIRMGEPIPLALMTGLINGVISSMMGLVSFHTLPTIKEHFTDYWRYLMLQLNMKTTQKTLKGLKAQIHENQRVLNEDKALTELYNSTFSASLASLSRYRDEFGTQENEGSAWHEYNGN